MNIDLQEWKDLKELPLYEARYVQLFGGITPPHAVCDAKVLSISRSFRKQGWKGRPIVATEVGWGLLKALTGSHRLAAASRDDEVVPVVILMGKPRLICLRELKADRWQYYDYKTMSKNLVQSGYGRLGELLLADFWE